MALKKLPIGIENFSEFFTENYYYVDKTGFLSELLKSGGKVNLFTRPRRFGKSLNMDMLKTFFEIGSKKELFDGLKISQEKELCEEYMGQFPVVSITLKGVSGMSFTNARNALCNTIGNEARRFEFLSKSEKLADTEKKLYTQLIEPSSISAGNDKNLAMYTMTDSMLEQSLKTLCELLYKHFDRKVILLIDEYDVPLDKAFNAGYYDQMVEQIRSLFDNALKSNNYLQTAVLTGCLRVSKESIFTGLNNLKVLSITSARYDEYFGFTDDEVKQLLDYYGLSKSYDTVKAWYNGYQFGNASVYCPWDVINYVDELCEDPDTEPKNYWANTSGNDLVRRFIDKANLQTKEDIERLIAGESVVKEINMELTYSELDDDIVNLWSVLLATGYLTSKEKKGDRYRLTIPNQEIRTLFVKQIQKWFNETTANDTRKLDEFCNAFPAGDAETIERLFNDYLWNTISIRDTAAQKEKKENFFHGILLGLLSHQGDWSARSNAESGEGYSDILVRIPRDRIGVVIEVKYAEGGRLDQACAEALRQIEDKHYDAPLLEDGMQTIVKIGIACFKKMCKVVSAQGAN